MATVTGFTADRMLEIENTTVVDGEVVGDDLHLLQRDGTPINAGNVRGPQGVPGPSGVGIPPGGIVDQVLTKTGAPNYQVGWGTPNYRIFASKAALDTGSSVGNWPGIVDGCQACTVDTGAIWIRKGGVWVLGVPRVASRFRLPTTTNTFQNNTTNVVFPVTVDRTALTMSNFVKVDSASSLFVKYSGTVAITAGVSQIFSLALRIGGTDYDMGPIRMKQAVDWQTFAFNKPLTGIAAGTYTIEPVFRGQTGAFIAEFQNGIDPIGYEIIEMTPSV